MSAACHRCKSLLRPSRWGYFCRRQLSHWVNHERESLGELTKPAPRRVGAGSQACTIVRSEGLTPIRQTGPPCIGRFEWFRSSLAEALDHLAVVGNAVRRAAKEIGPAAA
jgi:hypothetical protein